MDFRKKLKIRLFVAIGCVALGIAMITAFNILGTDNSFPSSFGLALIVIGAVRIRNYFRITKDEETIKKQQIIETDERNIAIASKAKSVSFFVYVISAGLSVIVLEFLNKTELATIISLTVCALIVIYWFSYWIIRKRS